MNDIGTKLKEARLKRNLSVKELSDKTKVRAFVIESIEREDYSVMPDVYIKSFIKTLTTYLKIDYEDISQEIKPLKSKKKKFDDEKIEKEIPVKHKSIEKEKTVIEPVKSINSENSHFAELFKRKNIDKNKKYNYINKIIYIILFLAVTAAIYFAFTSLNKSSDDISNSDLINGTDTVSLKKEEDNLFSYFEKPDSLRLTAKSHDTVWIRVFVDGKTLFESLLRPGMEESWAAKDYFIVDLGNVGGADIYRNDEKLPQFGRSGTVVKNIKITSTEVLNTYSSKPDSTRVQKKKKPEIIPQQPKIIQQSPIQSSPKFMLPKRDSLKF